MPNNETHIQGFNPENTLAAFKHLSDKQLIRRRKIFNIFNKSLLVKYGTKISYLAFISGLPVSFLVPKSIFRIFVGGTKLEECLKLADTLSENNVNTILDYAVEAKSGKEAYQQTLQENLKALRVAADSLHINHVSAKISGLADNELLEEMQSRKPLSDNLKRNLSTVKDRLQRLAKTASQTGTQIFFDAEESWVQDSMDKLTEELILRFNTQRVVVYNTYQLYRNDKLAYLKSQIEDAKSKGYILGAKLVRGAYMEKERKHAIQKGIPCIIHLSKEESDADFDKAVALCLENIEHVSFCIATHNEESCKKAIEKAIELNIPLNHPHFFFSQLYGMGDHITYNLAKAGCNATKYIPYGPLKEAIPYLIRRIEENTSVAGQVTREFKLLQTEIERRNLG